jgi:hypothetical protein
MLVDCLRCAIHNSPPPESLESTNWGSLLRQARQHRVEHFLFPWLAKNIPQLFSTDAAVEPDSAPAAWRSLALEHLQTTIIRQLQTTELLQKLSQDRIDVIPLKGTWLSEKIYDEPSQRSMADIDILVHKCDIERAHAILTAAGYQPKRDQLKNKYIYDNAYYHPSFKAFIELHWNVESEMIEGSSIPEIEKIWNNTQKAVLFGSCIREFTIEDQLSHLIQHILHHRMALSLRSYIDIALILKMHLSEIASFNFERSASYWKIGTATIFILQIVSELFGIPLPDQCNIEKAGIEKDLLHSACSTLFELPEANSRDHEYNFLKYRQSSAMGKIKLIASRIFMPQTFMALHYPFARHKLLLPLAWFLRAMHLIQHTGRDLFSLKQNRSALDNAAIRKEIIQKLTQEE